MDLPGVTVTDVDFQPAKVVVTVRLRLGEQGAQVGVPRISGGQRSHDGPEGGGDIEGLGRRQAGEGSARGGLHHGIEGVGDGGHLSALAVSATSDTMATTRALAGVPWGIGSALPGRPVRRDGRPSG